MFYLNNTLCKLKSGNTSAVAKFQMPMAKSLPIGNLFTINRIFTRRLPIKTANIIYCSAKICTVTACWIWRLAKFSSIFRRMCWTMKKILFGWRCIIIRIIIYWRLKAAIGRVRMTLCCWNGMSQCTPSCVTILSRHLVNYFDDYDGDVDFILGSKAICFTPPNVWMPIAQMWNGLLKPTVWSGWLESNFQAAWNPYFYLITII